ncbi:uncharacterized protein CLUP02_03861 [Colletotrichum lupini]|uniref:Uncharacterized protein n=1 Tax=Colletotrichum lupini TaxID=145971 RepID=A0A9Q8WCK1_9PEZI|nr:uncharacterized protein CLUP02_03861 [Colletotrichum lupini]UQC78384.1 hypothetical protein CLUP02_03861 [Colletotrichum lupini]
MIALKMLEKRPWMSSDAQLAVSHPASRTLTLVLLKKGGKLNRDQKWRGFHFPHPQHRRIFCRKRGCFQKNPPSRKNIVNQNCMNCNVATDPV